MHNKDGKWMPRRTYGDAPIYKYGAGAVVHNDTMYLICGTSSGPDKDYRVVRQNVFLVGINLCQNKVMVVVHHSLALSHLQVNKTMQ